MAYVPAAEKTPEELEASRAYFRAYQKKRRELGLAFVQDPEIATKRRRDLRRRKVKMISDYKAEQGCSVCGESRSPCLDLHHVDPSTKRKDMRKKDGRQWSTLSYGDIAVELAKCIVLCANCHRAEHHAKA